MECFLHSFRTHTHTTEVVEELEAQLGEDWRVGNPYQVILEGEKSRGQRPSQNNTFTSPKLKHRLHRYEKWS